MNSKGTYWQSVHIIPVSVLTLDMPRADHIGLKYNT